MTSPIETNNVVEREPRYFGIPLSEMCRTAREAPGRIDNCQLEWLADTAQSLSDRIDVLEGALQLVRRIAEPLIQVDDAWEDATHIVTAIDNALTQGGK